jgi:hypothetical protein
MKAKTIALLFAVGLFLMLMTPLAGALPPDPHVYHSYPTDGATDVVPDASLSVNATVESLANHSMKARCWTNASGSFVWSNWVGPFYNTTINWNLNASDYSTTYYWGVRANDSYGNVSNTTFTFTTEDEAVPETPQTLADAIIPVIMAMVTIVVVLGLIGVVMKMFEKWR